MQSFEGLKIQKVGASGKLEEKEIQPSGTFNPKERMVFKIADVQKEIARQMQANAEPADAGGKTEIMRPIGNEMPETRRDAGVATKPDLKLVQQMEVKAAEAQARNQKQMETVRLSIARTPRGPLKTPPPAVLSQKQPGERTFQNGVFPEELKGAPPKKSLVKKFLGIFGKK